MRFSLFAFRFSAFYCHCQSRKPTEKKAPNRTGKRRKLHQKIVKNCENPEKILTNCNAFHINDDFISYVVLMRDIDDDGIRQALMCYLNTEQKTG